MTNKSIKHQLRSIIDKNDTLAGKIFDWLIEGVILLSLISFSMETLPNLHSETQQILHLFETCTILLFTMEYLLRIYVAENRKGFLLSFFGIIDLLAILPFYLSSGIDLRTIRSFRLLRLFRAFKILRYGKAIYRFHQAFLLIREELVLFFSVALLVFFFSAVGIYYFENPSQPEAFQSIFHCMWWAVSTLTTVGYGDIYPITGGGKIFTFVVLMVGLGIVAIPSGLIASALTEARRLENKDSPPSTSQDGQTLESEIESS